jgi:hypothetical protein
LININQKLLIFIFIFITKTENRMASPWSLSWAQIMPRLIDQLDPDEALHPLKKAFYMGGATSIPALFNTLSGRGTFTGVNSEGNCLKLLNVLYAAGCSKVPAVIEFERVFISFFPNSASLIKRD